MMTRYGLSMETVKLYALEGSAAGQGGKRERVLAMPVDEEGLFHGFQRQDVPTDW